MPPVTPARTLVLVCNSHIDPVWLWPWEEGLAQALATFRAAAAFCEERDGFAFCHNEALLYRWVEEHEPALFDRIRALIVSGRWHVMGGWYLQPDCNLPCGESIARQAIAGKRYFLDRFGVEPRVGVNLDSFGHSRGLVQILKKSGSDGYVFCRPDRAWLTLPSDDFRWIGYDGSSVIAHRARDHYNSTFGRAAGKIGAWIAANSTREAGLLFWGVGNHGGGPSRQDLDAIASLAASEPGWNIRHGKPEDYLAAIEPHQADLPAFAGSLHPWAVGCYTTMARVKRQYRRLEGAYLAAEKLMTEAAVAGRMPYPRAELDDALADLLFTQFHDALAGTSVAEVESQILERLGHGLTIVDRLRARAFFAALDGQPAGGDGDYPVFAQNPHPFPVSDTFVCELQPPEPNADRATWFDPILTDSCGRPVPCQVEKESCNIQVDQRKRLVFQATLPPACITRFTCRIDRTPATVLPSARAITGTFAHRTDAAEIVIDGATGLLAAWRHAGTGLLKPGAAQALVLADTADPWAMKVRGFRNVVGRFRLMAPERAAAFAGVAQPALAPVRVIEQGPVRTIIEALFEYGHSAMCLRYVLPARGAGFGIDARVYWLEPDRMLKLALPTTLAGGRVRAESIYGAEEYGESTDERVGQRWIMVSGAPGAAGQTALTVINDGTCGFDFCDGELRLSLLRSAAYAGHPVDDVTPIVRQDRFEPRIDQGERCFRFWLAAGPTAERIEAVSREAAARHAPPFVLNAFPAGGGPPAPGGLSLSDGAVVLGALKMADDGRGAVVRLFEPTGVRRSTTVMWPALHLSLDVDLGPFEIRTFAVDPITGTVTETDLLERPLPAHR